MSNDAPIFSMPEPHHFSDYGFDAQIDYFQVLEEARRHKRESSRSMDTLRFTLQKPISKDDLSSNKTNKPNKKRWWKKALLFFKLKWAHIAAHYGGGGGDRDVHRARARALRASMSGPVYVPESRSGPRTPCRTTSSRPASGPITGSRTPARWREVEIPYLSLRELTMQRPHRIPASALPVCLVT